MRKLEKIEKHVDSSWKEKKTKCINYEKTNELH